MAAWIINLPETVFDGIYHQRITSATFLLYCIYTGTKLFENTAL
jgi:hypothetical protein